MNYPRIYNAAVDMVDRNIAQGRTAKPAFIDPNETLTYGELQTRCNRMANLAATYGIEREARIALLLLDTADFPVAFWGAVKAGVVPVCLNTLLTTEQYAYILGDSRARALFVSAQLLPLVQPVLGQLPFLKHVFVSGSEPPPFALSFRGELQFQAPQFVAADTCCDETAFWLYSSGSTGMPKGVRHVHSSPMETARLRLCVSAGEALPAEVGKAFRDKFGVDVLDGVGSTEMLHQYVCNSPGAVKYGTSGKPVPGYEVRLVDEHGCDVPDGEVGELLVKGPSAAEGYWNQREKSRATFEGGWTRSGDKYTRDAEGYYVYQGRTDDMFKVSGIWVSPFEVESALVGHEAVLEAAVVPKEDADGLLKPKAFIVLKPGRTADNGLDEELKAHVKVKAGVWKYPRWIAFVDGLPKTATGKVQRFKLREG